MTSFPTPATLFATDERARQQLQRYVCLRLRALHVRGLRPALRANDAARLLVPGALRLR